MSCQAFGIEKCFCLTRKACVCSNRFRVNLMAFLEHKWSGWCFFEACIKFKGMFFLLKGKALIKDFLSNLLPFFISYSLARFYFSIGEQFYSLAHSTNNSSTYDLLNLKGKEQLCLVSIVFKVGRSRCTVRGYFATKVRLL